MAQPLEIPYPWTASAATVWLRLLDCRLLENPSLAAPFPDVSGLIRFLSNLIRENDAAWERNLDRKKNAWSVASSMGYLDEGDGPPSWPNCSGSSSACSSSSSACSTSTKNLTRSHSPRLGAVTALDLVGTESIPVQNASQAPVSTSGRASGAPSRIPPLSSAGAGVTEKTRFRHSLPSTSMPSPSMKPPGPPSAHMSSYLFENYSAAVEARDAMGIEDEDPKKKLAFFQDWKNQRNSPEQQSTDCETPSVEHKLSAGSGQESKSAKLVQLTHDQMKMQEDAYTYALELKILETHVRVGTEATSSSPALAELGQQLVNQKSTNCALKSVSSASGEHVAPAAPAYLHGSENGPGKPVRSTAGTEKNTNKDGIPKPSASCLRGGLLHGATFMSPSHNQSATSSKVGSIFCQGCWKQFSSRLVLIGHLPYCPSGDGTEATALSFLPPRLQFDLSRGVEILRRNIGHKFPPSGPVFCRYCESMVPSRDELLRHLIPCAEAWLVREALEPHKRYLISRRNASGSEE